MKPNFLRRHAAAIVIAAVAIVAVIAVAATYLLSNHKGPTAWIYIPRDASSEAVADTLRSVLGPDEGSRVATLWKLQGGDAAKARGAYRVETGQKAIATARRIAQGRQSPVNLTFNNLRTLDRLAARVALKMECDSAAFIAAADSILSARGFERAEYVAAFIPDTYEMYWTAGPADIIERLLDYHDAFWRAERMAKADALGLSPEDVATIASIVEEESNKTDEYPMIARLYLNRLNKGMRLQADPTVKFAVGDWSLRRVRGRHLSTPSPYNTYLNAGLPPGPIRIPAASAIDAVLDAPKADYLYMCARPDFSGYHDFSSDYQTHRENARRYQAALTARAIN